MHENVIEWFDEDDHIAVTLHQKRFVNRVKKLAIKDKRVQILAENKDGSIFAHLPKEMLKLGIKTKQNLSVEKKAELSERMKKIRAEQLARARAKNQTHPS